jgi:sugar phosphate isomerase/epimerase
LLGKKPAPSKEEKDVLIGFTVEGYQEWHPAVITAAMRRLGVNFIEYNRRIFDELDRVLPQVRNMRTAFHLPIIHDDGWDFSCTAFDQEIAETIAILQRHHQQLGLTHIVAHPPEAHLAPHPHESSIEALFAAVARLPLPVYFENVPDTSPQQFRDFLSLAKSRLGAQCAGMCFDAAHFMVSGHDPVEQFLAFRDQIGCVHLSDCIGTDDAHLPFNSGGNLPVKMLLQAMRKTGYNGSITLEIRPDAAGNLTPFIESYLLLLGAFARGRYFSARLRLLAVQRLIRKRS